MRENFSNVQSDQDDQGPLSDEGGFALVVVIWAIGLVSTLFLAFVMSVRTQTQLTSNALATATLEAYADAGVNIAILDLIRTAKLLPEKWRLPHNSEPVVCRIADDTNLAISVQDEEGRVDLNTATGPVLSSLIEGLGVNSFDAARHVDTLLDFRDADDLHRLNGAERREYQLAGMSGGPKDLPFETVDELYQVLGFPPPLVKRLQPLVTVYSNRGGIDPRVAPIALLKVLSGGARIGPDLPLPSFAITSTGRLFSVRVEATRPDGSAFVREATVERKRTATGAFQLRRWERGELFEASAGRYSTRDVALPNC